MEKNQIVISILLGTSVLLLLAGFLLFFLIRYRTRKNQFIQEGDKLKKEFEQTLLLSQVEVQENTFAALSNELHDNICQLLVTTKALISVTQMKQPEPLDTLTIAEETLGKTINELRSISKALDKEWLRQFNFIENLKTEVNRINALQTLHIELLTPEYILLPAEEQLILFRIVQEALQNAVKHSEAEHISIDVSHSVSSLLVKITDNGKGFKEQSLDSAGLGLKNMKQRTQLLGGTIEWIASHGEGSTVILKLPVKKSDP